MPAQRLPWIKFWPEALDHEKFAALSDAERWSWVVIWAKASMQPKRWKFASARHAQHVTGRPLKHIRRLIEVGLIDELSNGSVLNDIVMHDAAQWQDVSGITQNHRHPEIGKGDARVTEDQAKGDATVTTPPSKGDLEGEGEGDIEKTASLRASLPSPSLERRGGFRPLGSLLPKRPEPPAPPPGFRTEESVGERFDRKARQAGQPANGINSETRGVA